MGPTGPQGPQGPTGEVGAQGRVGVVARWISYREFWFENGSANIPRSETNKLAEVASYMKNNSSLQIGIDASMDPRGTDARDQDLCNRRVKSIREALIEAGVPANRIAAGAFGDKELRRDRRVEVLFRTAQ
jgi:outer membrane protein OmpA-like peptidoglycan-associated protein